MASVQIGNTILGAGIISLPVVIRYLGILLGSLFIIFVGILSNFAVFLLLKGFFGKGFSFKYSSIFMLFDDKYLIAFINILFFFFFTIFF